VAWDVEYTDQFEAWWDTLAEAEQDAIDAAIAALEEHGPALGRPLVENIHQSRHPNMKQLRVPGTIRILSTFDLRRTAILLTGGDTRQSWNTWYDRNIPIADDLYEDHLNKITGTTERRESRWPSPTRTCVTRSEAIPSVQRALLHTGRRYRTGARNITSKRLTRRAPGRPLPVHASTLRRGARRNAQGIRRLRRRRGRDRRRRTSGPSVNRAP